jgi:hypothetical protein
MFILRSTASTSSTVLSPSFSLNLSNLSGLTLQLRLCFLSLCLVFLSFLPSLVQAKDLTQRLGVGVKQEDGLTQAIVHYYPTADYTWVGGLGVDTETGASRTHLSLGLRRHIFFESQLNAYIGGRVSFLSQEVGVVSQSGFVLAGVSGVEFFFSGLDSLGFQAEIGLELASLGSVSRFRTTGGTLAQTGVVFYF